MMNSFLSCCLGLSALAFVTAAQAGDAKSALTDAKPQVTEAAKAIPADDVVNASIESGFSRWSAAWMWDRFIPGTVKADDRGLRDGVYLIRGTFGFARMGARQTIPFAASFTQVKGAYALSNLCYNDTTTGMTACIDPSDGRDGERAAAAMQSRQALGAIVALGLVAAMSSDDEVTCVRRYTLFGEPYLECDDH